MGYITIPHQYLKPVRKSPIVGSPGIRLQVMEQQSIVTEQAQELAAQALQIAVFRGTTQIMEEQLT